MLFDFEKHSVVDSLDVLPETVRPLYVEKDGKFSLNPALKPFVEAYVGTDKALETTRRDLTKANNESASRRVSGKALMDFLKAQGVEQVDEANPFTTLETFTADLIAANKKGGEVKINLDKVRQESEKRIAEIKDGAAAENAKMRTSLEKYLVSQAATKALADAGGSTELLLPIISKYAKVVQDGDDYAVRIVDDQGEVRSNGAGGYMDFTGLVADLKTKPAYQPAFKSEVAAGTGHKPGAAQREAGPRRQEGEKSSVDKIAAGLAKQGIGKGV